MSIPSGADDKLPPPPDPAKPSLRERLAFAWADPGRRPALVIGVFAVGLALVLVFVAIGQLSPTPEVTATPTPDTGCVINCETGPQAAPPIPKVIHVRGRSIFITPVNVTEGRWTYSTDNGKAEWVYGTLVNYVIGLPTTQENNDMLQALSESDDITLDMSNGQTLDFRFSGRQFVSPKDSSIFAQLEPGLTLALLGDSADQRLVVQAKYQAESEVGRAVAGSFAQINTPVEIGGARVTVLSARLVYNAPGIPVGSEFYLVDFSVENIGSDPLDASKFEIVLQDYAQQKYKISETASKLGPNSPPTGQVLPGSTATFLSGFEVPTNVTGPVLVWIFRPQPGFAAQANVVVPLVGPTPTPDPRSQVSVQITQAYFNDDQTELTIVGGVGNPTASTVVVSTADISLSTPEGILATLRGSEPALPWNLGPGQNQTFTLRFSRLPGNSATLKVLFSSFELSLE